MSVSILKKFGYPNHLIKDYTNWIILLRPEQITIGSLVLIEKSFQKKFSKVTLKSLQELSIIIKEVENTLKKLFGYNKINYLMLMMVDPEVHLHVIPRYSKNIVFNKKSFSDTGWPKLPELNYVNKIDINTRKKLINTIKSKFNTVDK